VSLLDTNLLACRIILRLQVGANNPQMILHCNLRAVAHDLGIPARRGECGRIGRPWPWGNLAERWLQTPPRLLPLDRGPVVGLTDWAGPSANGGRAGAHPRFQNQRGVACARDLCSL